METTKEGFGTTSKGHGDTGEEVSTKPSKSEDAEEDEEERISKSKGDWNLEISHAIEETRFEEIPVADRPETHPMDKFTKMAPEELEEEEEEEEKRETPKKKAAPKHKKSVGETYQRRSWRKKRHHWLGGHKIRKN